MFHSSQGESVLKQEIKILAVFGIRMLVKVQVSMIILVSVAKNKLELLTGLDFKKLDGSVGILLEVPSTGNSALK